MVKKYKKIMIVYGGRGGRGCADRIDEAIKGKHEKDNYPVESVILANELLQSFQIIEKLKEMMKQAAATIILLTFEDAEEKRVRQNVLIEIGLALAYCGIDNCYFFSEITPLPSDFPSDLRTCINPNRFDREYIDALVKKIEKEIIGDKMRLNSSKGILKKSEYDFNLNELLDDVPETVFIQNVADQMMSIQQIWKDSVNSFDFFSEKIMYIAERIHFLTVFSCDNNLMNLLKAFHDSINPYIGIDYPEDKNITDKGAYEKAEKEYNIEIFNLMDNILQYSQLKLNREVLDLFNDARRDESKRSALIIYRDRFKGFSDAIFSFIDKIKTEEEKNSLQKTEEEKNSLQCNWLLKLLAYEYAGLAGMKAIECGGFTPDEIIENTQKYIKYYNKAIDIANIYDPINKALWQGYLKYDVARAYVEQYKALKAQDPEKEHDTVLGKIREHSYAAIAIRKSWSDSFNLPDAFASALTSEYFIAAHYDLQLLKKYPEYRKVCGIDGEIKTYLQNLLDSIQKYVGDPIFRRMKDMADEIVKTIEETKDASKESEDTSKKSKDASKESKDTSKESKDTSKES